jgi:hypothetical protein
MAFASYEEVPAHVAQKLIDAHSSSEHSAA